MRFTTASTALTAYALMRLATADFDLYSVFENITVPTGDPRKRSTSSKSSPASPTATT